MFYLIGIVFLTIFAGTNIYIGMRGWSILKQLAPFVGIYLYWTLFVLIALSFFVGRAGRSFLPSSIDRIFNIVGGYWIAALFYLAITSVILGAINIIIRLTGMDSYFRGGVNIRLISDLIAISIIIIILAYGTYNASHSKIVKYNVNINKKAGSLNELNVVTISDLHLGSIIGKSRLDEMVNKINELNPDIVFLVGDIIDDDIEPFIHENMGESFKSIKSKYGVYAVLGNHEYIGKNIERTEQAYKSANIRLLKDEVQKIDDSFYVVGRDDASSERFSIGKRKDVSELIQNCNKSLPIIVMDHQPVKLQQAKQAGVDLQFSGHTHKGQFFPTELITKRIFEIDWGYLKDGNYNIIVSSGVGTWGPPIRVGSSSEIVQTNVGFLK